MAGLSGIRVVDFTSGIAGPYSSKLFADGGADVIKVEPAGGDWLRRFASQPEFLARRPGDSAFFQYLNTCKRSVTGSPADPAIRELIASADLVIEDFPGDSPALAALDIPTLVKQHPGLVILSISPFGRTGPYAHRPATEFTVQAECGATGMRGLPSQAPYMAGGRIGDFTCGTFAAAIAAATLRGARRTGIGEHIDFSMTEAMNIAGTVYVDLVFSLLGRPEFPGAFRQVETPSIEPTKDGYVGFNTNSRKHFDQFLKMIGREDWIGDEGLASHFTRQFRLDEWNAAVWHWTRQHTTAECIAAATRYGVPVAPVNNGKTVLEHEQLVARKVYVKNPAGDFLQPRPPYQLNGKIVRAFSPAPHLGEHNGTIEPHTPCSLGVQARQRELPLQGLRVLDITTWWAGPMATHLLALLGAEVIHVESVKYLDGARTVVVAPTGDNWWEQGHIYQSVNSNKRAITLDFTDEEGLALLKQLIADSDILVENFAPRVFEGIGLGREAVLALNPSIVFARMPAFGLDGPWRDNLGFAQTMEQMSGLAWLTGHAEDQPRIQRGPCDPVAGLHAAFAILVALAEREQTGKGQFVECTMVEGALNIAAEQVIEYSAYGHIQQREGNRSPYAAPQGIYACRGEENWLALSIETDAQWQAFSQAIGNPAWAQEAALQTHAGRRAEQDALDAHLARWASEQELAPTVERLVAAGVPAATLLDCRMAYKHPQIAARGFFETVTHPVAGTHPLPSLPARFASRDAQPWIQTAAPTLGQHNREVLASLGVDDARLAALDERNVTGTKPVKH